MTLRIERVTTHGRTVVRLIGRVQSECLAEIQAQLEDAKPVAGEVRILDRATRALVRTLWVGGTPRNVSFDPLGTTALVTTEEAVVFIQ